MQGRRFLSSVDTISLKRGSACKPARSGSAAMLVNGERLLANAFSSHSIALSFLSRRAKAQAMLYIAVGLPARAMFFSKALIDNSNCLSEKRVLPSWYQARALFGSAATMA